MSIRKGKEIKTTFQAIRILFIRKKNQFRYYRKSFFVLFIE